jgi:hypothetical protein
MDDMIGITDRLAPMSDETQQRLDRAMATIADTKDTGSADELEMLLARRDELIAATA